MYKNNIMFETWIRLFAHKSQIQKRRRKKMKGFSKALCLMLSVVMLLSLAACGGNSAEDEETQVLEKLETNEDVASIAEQVERDADKYIEVNIGIGVDPASFAPAAMSNTGRVAILPMLYEHLFTRVGSVGDYTEQVGKTKVYENEGKDIRVEIWDNVYDSAGNHITTADVKFSYEKMYELGFTEHYQYLAEEDPIEIVNDFEMIFHHKEANPNLEKYTFEKGFVFSQKAFEESPDGFAMTPVLTGRYMLTDYVAGSYYTFEENKNYWGLANGQEHINPASYANCDKITYKIIADSSQMANALKTGSIDMINNLGAEQLLDFYDPLTKTATEGYIVTAGLSTVSYCLQFNCSAEHSKCADVNVRKAIAYCIDNQDLVDIVLEGRGSPNLLGTWVEDVTPLADWDEIREWYQEEGYLYNGANIEKAKECLAAAGYPNGIELVCMVNTDATMVKQAQVVQTMCREAGIEIDIKSFDSALFDTYRVTPDTGWDFLSTCWGAASDVYFHNTLLFSPTGYGELGDRNFITEADDPMLFDMWRTLCSFGSTAEDANAFGKYAFLDQCYDYGLFDRNYYVVAQDGVTLLVAPENIYPQLCQFADDYQCGEPSGK